MSSKPTPPPKPSFTKILSNVSSTSRASHVKKELFPSQDANTDTELNLLDEIYAEIEDKHANKLIISNLKAISISQKTRNDIFCASLSCSSSSYTSASSTQSNACSCASNYSSSSVASSSTSAYSSGQGSDSLGADHRRPPLPNGPPPPLSNSNKTIQPSPDTSLSLEQEIEIEMRMKRDSFCLLRSAEELPPVDTAVNKCETNSEEDEYLEPILLETTTEVDASNNRKTAFDNPDSTVLSSNSESGYDEQKNNVNPYCVPYACNVTTSTPVKNCTSSPAKTALSSPYRLKSLFKLNTAVTPIKPVNVEPAEMPKSSKKLSLHYYSGKISSTLRLMRSRSSTQDLTACHLTEEIDIRPSAAAAATVESSVSELWTLKRRKKNAKSVDTKSEQQQQQTSSVQISSPTLISQTFDLSKQNLLPISQSSRLESADRPGHLSLSSFSSSGSECLEAGRTLSLVGDECPSVYRTAGSNLSINNISPTIAFDTIITNVYEEDGKKG